MSIDEEGNVKVTVFGVPGPKCLQVTEKLEQLLGGGVEREFTSEYFAQTEEARSRVQVKDRG